MSRLPICIFAVGAALLALLGTARADALQTPVPDANSPFGINGIKWFHGMTSPTLFQDAERDANLMRRAGMAWDRFDAWWGAIEPHQGQFDWSFMDRVVEFNARHGISTMPILCYSSAWSGGKPPLDDAERERYANYVYQMVSRYRDRVHAWEIWNEPNIPTFWKPQPSAHDYALLLRAAYAAAKRADPTCTVVGGATSMADINYLLDLYHYGAWDSMDVVSIHPYSMGGNAHQQRLDRILASVQAMNRATGKPKPVWVTEIGWTSSGPTQDRDQAISLFQTYCFCLAAGVRCVFWFCLTDWSERWGLVRTDGSLKPSYAAYSRLARALGGARFAGYLPWRLGPEFRGLVFAKDGRPLVAAWCQGAPVRLKLRPAGKGGLRAVDALGNALPTTGGTLAVGTTPVLIEGASPTLLRQLAEAPPVYPNANLVWNPVFEETVGAMPADWGRGRHEGTGKAGRFWLSNDATTGKHSAAISNAEDAAWDTWPVPVRPGDHLVLAAKVRGIGATGTNAIALYFWDGVGWGYVGSVLSPPLPPGNTSWRKLTVAATVPSRAYMVRVDLISRKNQGTVLFDDVKLTCRPAGPRR